MDGIGSVGGAGPSSSPAGAGPAADVAASAPTADVSANPVGAPAAEVAAPAASPFSADTFEAAPAAGPESSAPSLGGSPFGDAFETSAPVGGGLFGNSLPSSLADARASSDRAMAVARNVVEARDRVNYTPEALDQKARDFLDAQPTMEVSHAGPSVRDRVQQAWDRVMNPVQVLNDLFAGAEPTAPRPSQPRAPSPRIAGR